MDLKLFSKDILGKEISLNILKIILFMLSNDKKSIDIDELCSNIYIGKQKIKNEISKFRPIEGYLTIDIGIDSIIFNVLNDSFQLDDKKITTKSKTKKEIKIKEVNDAINIVFDYWCLIMNKTDRIKLDSNRRKAIVRGLDNHTIEECKLAILGCSKNLWNMGKAVNNTKVYDSLDLIFRNLDKTNDFIRDSALPSIEEQLNLKPKSNSVEDRLNNNDWMEKRVGLFSQLSEFENEKDVIAIENKKDSEFNSGVFSTLELNIEEENESLIDIKGLVDASESAFFKFFVEDKQVREKIEVIEGEFLGKE